jgi:hypothetical protein
MATTSIAKSTSTRLSGQLEAENEYQSDVAPGAKKNDLKYYTSIGIDF